MRLISLIKSLFTKKKCEKCGSEHRCGDNDFSAFCYIVGRGAVMFDNDKARKCKRYQESMDSYYQKASKLIKNQR